MFYYRLGKRITKKTYIFSLKLTWKDKRLDCKFLKDENHKNALSKALLDQIWFPNIQYLLVFEDSL